MKKTAFLAVCLAAWMLLAAPVLAEEVSDAGWGCQGSSWYYTLEDGTRAAGWQAVDGAWYHFGAGGVMDTGWLQDGSAWYYLGRDGAMVTGWAKVNGAWYYFANTGAMKTGWMAAGGDWYYFRPDGSMATGWAAVGGSWYYFDEDGAMYTGFLKDDAGYTYYLRPNGSMATGWEQVDGKWYHLEPGTGRMFFGTWGIDGVICHFGGDGRWIETPADIPANPSESEKTRMARAVAQQIADSISTDLSDLERVSIASRIVANFCYVAEYTSDVKDYNKPYGVFVKGVYTCAGSTRALGLVLECMGYTWKHVNPNMWTHQWCELEMDGILGFADGMAGFAGYGRHPMG